MKIKGLPSRASTEFAVFSDDGSVAEVSPRALGGFGAVGSVGAAADGADLGRFCACVVCVVVVDVG
jgi:hypothetical protein